MLWTLKLPKITEKKLSSSSRYFSLSYTIKSVYKHNKIRVLFVSLIQFFCVPSIHKCKINSFAWINHWIISMPLEGHIWCRICTLKRGFCLILLSTGTHLTGSNINFPINEQEQWTEIITMCIKSFAYGLLVIGSSIQSVQDSKFLYIKSRGIIVEIKMRGRRNFLFSLIETNDHTDMYSILVLNIEMFIVITVFYLYPWKMFSFFEKCKKKYKNSDKKKTL